MRVLQIMLAIIAGGILGGAVLLARIVVALESIADSLRNGERK